MPRIDYDALSLREFIQLQDEIGREMQRRFRRFQALIFTDVVGSTTYFERWGDAAGRALIERHNALLTAALRSVGGRIIDTAGDGAFSLCENVERGLAALQALQETVGSGNAGRPSHQHLRVRSGLHWGAVLMDGPLVTGDAVNLAARVAASAHPAGIRLTEAAYEQLPVFLRVRCKRLPEEQLKGIREPVRMLRFDWRDPSRFPTTVRVQETGEVFEIPRKERVTFGRLAEHEGVRANDVVLSHPDPQMALRISRWHMELSWTPEGFLLRPLSRGAVEIEGVRLTRDTPVLVTPGTSVRVSRVLTLVFMTERGPANQTIPATMLDVDTKSSQ